MTREITQQTGSQIRRAQHQDAEILACLCNELGYPTEADKIRARIGAIAQEQRRAIFVALDESHEVVGFIDLEMRCLMVHDDVAEIAGLVVSESARGNGYGRMLLERAERWAREMGAVSLNLRSNVIRKKAHEFYERAGFTVYKQSLAFTKRLA